MKKITAVFIAVLLTMVLCVSAFAADYPEPTSQFFVNDFADCITPEDETTMQQLAQSLYKNTKAQVVCVTVEDLDGMDVREYAIELAREWGIGDKENDTGVLLLLSTNDRQIDIEVGYGLEGALTDGKTGRILDTYAMPYLKQNDFSTGLKEAFTALVNETSTELGVSVDGYEPISEEPEGNGFGSMLGLLLACAIIVVVIRLARHSGGGGGNGSDDFGERRGGSVWPWIFLGNAMNNNRHGNDNDDDNPFGSGGFGGFGGGGGFSGGGGSFGGGGSSRGF